MLARVLMSWVNIDPNSPLARTLYDLTEPVLRPVRNALPPTAGLDFSPMIVLVLLQLLGRILVSMFTA
ncbi:MAG: YggT family protein [Chloroflexi bacterium]|nr:YggT family protein [Chloroflexota bacterium]